MGFREFGLYIISITWVVGLIIDFFVQAVSTKYLSTITVEVVLFFVLFLLLVSCQSGEKKDVTAVDSIKTEVYTEELTPAQRELITALDDPTVDEYYKEIYRQKKLVKASDEKMLSVTDSLFTANPGRKLFYFIVFTKSLDSADGFYSESAGRAAYRFVTTKTEWFADYFNVVSNLTERDMENWAASIFGEMAISRENEEGKAIRDLENLLLNNLKNTRKEYTVVIERLIEHIKIHAGKKRFKV